jgi:hypothetical protein
MLAQVVHGYTIVVSFSMEGMRMVNAEGRALVAKLEKWLSSWIVFRDDSHALVCVLWALHTWMFTKWSAVPYLCISAATKGAGKTALLECVSRLTSNPKLITDPTAAVIYSWIDAAREAGQSEPILCIDEAEKLNRETNDCRPALNAGYSRNGAIPRTVQGGGGASGRRVVSFNCFAPRAFALIGDVYDTLRDRSIVIRLVRSAAAPRRYRSDVAEDDAKSLRPEIERAMRALSAGVPEYEATHLSGRDEQIWLPILSLGHALLSPADFARLLRASADLTAEKTSEAASFIQLRAAAESAALDDGYSERALRDVWQVVRAATEAGYNTVPSDVVVKGMKEIPTGAVAHVPGRGANV